MKLILAAAAAALLAVPAANAATQGGTQQSSQENQTATADHGGGGDQGHRHRHGSQSQGGDQTQGDKGQGPHKGHGQTGFDQGASGSNVGADDKGKNNFRADHRYGFGIQRPNRVHVAPFHGSVGVHFGQHRPHDYNRHIYNRSFWATHRFHWRPYVRPHGWYYRRWVYGEFLPVFFWTQDYWLDNYWQFGLGDPPYDSAVWVRYGDDAILVDTDTGEIIQVVYGVFY